MKSLNLMGPVGGTGYGVVCESLLNKFMHLGIHISLFPRSDRVSEAYREVLENAQTFDPDAPTLNIWHQFDLAMRIGNGTYSAYPFFELDGFRQISKHHLKVPEILFLSSEWAKEVVLNHVDRDNIIIAEPGVDREIFYDRDYRPDGPTIFLNAGKWEVRKGHDILHEVFSKAFTPKDNVELWMLPHNQFLKPHEQESWEKMYYSCPMGDKIKILRWQQRHEDVASVMRKSDVGVFLSRAEGWNLELLEMMSCGKHVITTDYSAHTQFCKSNNSYLVQIDNTESAFDGRWFMGDHGNWAKIDSQAIDEAVEFMRTTHELVQSGNFQNFQGISTAKRLSWGNCAGKICEVLDIYEIL